MGTVRAIAAIPLGVVAGMAAMLLLLIPCFLTYPIPSGIDINDPRDAEAFGQHLASLPLTAYLLVLVAHAGGAFSGAAFCRLVEGAKGTRESLVIGSIFTAIGLVNAVSHAYPLWFTLLDLAVYIPAAMMGGYALNAAAESRHAPLPSHSSGSSA